MDQPRYPRPAAQSGPPLATPPDYAAADAITAPGYNPPATFSSAHSSSAHSAAHLRLLSAEDAPTTATRWGATSIGISATLAAGLGYLIGPLGVLFFFAEKRNRFLRFHCAQVILLAIVSVLLGTTWSAVIALEGLLGTMSSSTVAALVMGVSACAFGLAYLGLFGCWLWGMLSAFTGKYTKLPIIGNIAVRWAGGPPVPAL